MLPRAADLAINLVNADTYAGLDSMMTCKSNLALIQALALIAGLLTSLSTGCARYQFGTSTLHAPNISSVHIDMFENDTYRRGLGPWLTEAIVKEVELRTPFRIADSSSADSFLRGRLVSDRKNVIVESPNDDARDINYASRIEITWTDRTGTPLTQSRVFTITEDANLIPEAGQSLTTAQQELIQRLARQVVNQMEVAW